MEYIAADVTIVLDGARSGHEGLCGIAVDGYICVEDAASTSEGEAEAASVAPSCHAVTLQSLLCLRDAGDAEYPVTADDGVQYRAAGGEYAVAMYDTSAVTAASRAVISAAA